jgi:PAS domain S-box-containing protein
MLLKKGQSTLVDLNTLDMLPIAVAIFDNKKVYFVNKKAVQLFQISNKDLKNINSISVFKFLDKKYHRRIKKNNTKIINGEEFPPVELEFKTFKNKPIFIEAKSNCVLYKNKKVVQTTFIEISELKQKQIELERSEDLLEKISSNSLDVIFDLRFYPTTHLNFVSDSAKQILGYYPHEFYKNSLLLKNNIHKEDQKYLITSPQDYLKASRKKTVNIVQARFFDKTGKIKVLEIVANPVFDNKKKLIGLIGNIRDVTERIETEKLLIETKEKFDLITKSSNDIIAFYSYYPEEKYTYVSPNITKILGYKPQEFLKDYNFFNKRVIENKHDFIKIDVLVRNYQKNNIKKNYSYTFKTIKKNKEEIWLENNLTPIVNASGKIVFFLNIIRNITIQKEKEIELQQQHLNYRNLLDNSPAAYIIHKQGVTVFCNNAMLKLLQLKSEKQILGKFALDYIIEKDRMRAMDRIKDIYKGTNSGKATIWTIKDTKGNFIDAQMTSTTINFNNSNCILTLIINITEQRKAETEKLRSEMIKTNNEFLKLEIKERQETEKKLLEKTAQLTSIFESSNHLIWTINKNFEITSFNKNFANSIERRINIKIVPGVNIAKIMPKDYNEYAKFWHAKYKEAFTGKKLEFEKEDYEKNVKTFAKVFINPIYNKKNQVEEISCIAHDITDTKLYETKLINQSAKLLAVFESGSHLIWTINKDFEITSYNKNYFELIKNNINTDNKTPIHFKDTIVDKTLLAFWKKKYKAVFNGEQQIFIHKSKNKNKDVYREIFLHPIYSDNKIVEISAIAQDITERITNENKIIEQSAKLNAIFESGSQAMWTINKRREITSHNKNYEEAIFNLHGKKPILGKSNYSIEVGLNPESDQFAKFWEKQYDLAFSGKSIEFITERENKDKTPVIRQIYLQPIFNKNGEVEEVSGIAHDITDKKTSEQKLLNQAAKLNSIFDSSNHYIWTINNKQKLTSFNKNYFELITSIYNTQPYVGFSLDRGVLGKDKEYNEILDHNYKQAFAGNSRNFEIEILDKNYNKIYLEIFLNPVYHNDVVEEVSGIAHNVTEKILNHQRVEQSLKEKDVLLKEVHHRVKNNMQIISSILNLQSSYVTDAYTLALLKESQNRIKTMAYIHESLYQNKSFTSVNFSEYIQTLAKNITQSYVISSEKIELLLNLEKTSLNLDVSIPAGLIVNELITNAIKHAFPNSRKGKICLNLKSEDHTVYLEVKDNGVGIPHGFDFNTTNTLGLQLVNTLIDQLGGEIKFNSKKDGGTEVLIKFKM